MSDEEHAFHLNGVYVGKGDGDGVIRFDWGGTLEYGLPVSTGGKPGRSNPEEMLVGAVASCYAITLALLVEKRRLPVSKIEVSVDGLMVRQPDHTLRFTQIHLHPKITVPEVTPTNEEALLGAAHKAERYCLVSNALRGNVEITVAPEVIQG